MNLQLTPLPLPRTSAIDTSPFFTPFLGTISVALLQPRSREVPRSDARRRDSRARLRLTRVTGASRSGHAPRAALPLPSAAARWPAHVRARRPAHAPPPALPLPSAAARWAAPLSHSVGPPVWLETQVPGSL